MKKLLILSLAFMPSAFAQCAGYTSASTLTAGTVTGTLTNFPLVVTGTFTGAATVANGGYVTNASGFDVCFSNSGNTTRLTWQTRSWSATGAATYVVLVPSMATGTTIKMWAGNAGVSTFQGGTAAAVWDANFKGVYPLQESSGPYLDATSNADNSNSGANPTRVPGQIGFAQSFVAASSQSIKFNTAQLNSGTTFTISALHKAGSIVAAPKVIADLRGNAGQLGAVLYLDTSNKLNCYYNGAGGIVGPSALDGNWHYVSCTGDGGVLRLFVDGTQVDTLTGGSWIPMANSYSLIGEATDTTPIYANDLMQEVRISSVSRCSGSMCGWVAAETANLLTPASFVSQGSWTAPACSITTSSLPNGVTGAAYAATMAGNSCPSVSWSVAAGSLPAGLTLNSATGVITGTPSAAGTSSFTIAAASANGSDSKALSIVMNTLATITALAATANSPNSINLVWTTSSKTSSQASCGTVSGGPYPYASPTVDPVKPGDDYYGATSHSLAVVVPTTNASSTAYFCRVVSVDSSGSSVTSTEVSSGTTAALSNTPFTVITGPQGWIPYNDQMSGRHGSPNTGRGYRDDSFFCAWAGDGNNYCSLNDAWGTTSNGGGSWSGSGSLIATGVVQASADGMTIAMRGNTTGVNSTGALGDVNKPSTYTADGGRSWNEGVSCARGACITALPRAPGACTPLVLTRDYFQTTIAPQANTGPSVTGLTFTGAGRGTWGYPTNSSECSWTTYLNYRQFGFAQDWGGTPPRVGAPGYQFPVTHQAGTDAWIYSITYTNGVENWGIMRTPVNNIQVTQAGQTFAQMYNGSGHGADGFSDSNWVSVGSSVGMMFNQYPYGRRPTISWIGGSINRWVLMGYAPTPTASAGTGGSIDGSGGILIWDIGPYPWAIADAVLVGFLPPDPIMNPTFTPVFPQVLESTCKYPSDGSVTCMVTTTGSYLNTGTDEYGSYYRWVRFVPRAQSVSLPHTSWFGTKTTHIANGLDAFWLMDMPVWSTTITDHAGPKAGMPNGYQITGIGAQLAVNNGMGLAFGWPQAGAMGTPTTVTVATAYNKMLTDFTALLTFMHDPNQAAVSGETVLDKTDFQIIRNTTTANSWRIKVGGTTSSAFPLTTDGAFATLVVRRIGSQVTVYGNAGIGSNLPLTVLTTFNNGTALGANTLTLGSLAGGSQPFYGTIGELAIFSRGLSDAELITELGAVRSDMASRTPKVVIP